MKFRYRAAAAASALAVAAACAVSDSNPGGPVAPEEVVLVQKQQAESRDLSPGTRFHDWELDTGQSSIVSGIDVPSVVPNPNGLGVNPVFTVRRANLAVRDATNVRSGGTTKSTGLSSAQTELPSLMLFRISRSSSFEILMVGGGPSRTMVRVRVDGRWVDYRPKPGPPDDGRMYRGLLDLPDAGPHEVAPELSGYEARFGGLRVIEGSVVSPLPVSRAPRLIIFGDSQTEGNDGRPGVTGNTLGFAAEFGRLLGIEDTWQSGLGDTGYVGNSKGNSYTVGDRLEADVLAQNPTWVHLAAGQVDAGLSGSSSVNYEREKSAVVEVVKRIKLRLPVTRLTVQSPWRPYVGPEAAQGVAVRDAIRDACREENVTFVDVSAWLTGGGNAGTPRGDGNADSYLSEDGIHLSAVGHLAAARVLSLAFKRLGIS